MLKRSSQKGDYVISKLFLLIQASAFHPRGPFWQFYLCPVVLKKEKKKSFWSFVLNEATPPSPTRTPHALSAVESGRMSANWINFERRKMPEMLFLFCGAASEDPLNWGEHHSAESVAPEEQLMVVRPSKYLDKKCPGLMTHLLSCTTTAISRSNMQMISMFYASNAFVQSSKPSCCRVNVLPLRSLWPRTGLDGCVRPRTLHRSVQMPCWWRFVGPIPATRGQ